MVLDFKPSFVADGPMVAELERHKTNMNTKEKHIILSILKWAYRISDFTVLRTLKLIDVSEYYLFIVHYIKLPGRACNMHTQRFKSHFLID